MYMITIALLFYLNISFIFSVGALYGGLAAIQTVLLISEPWFSMQFTRILSKPRKEFF